MITLMFPLHLAAIFHPKHIALVADGERLTYRCYYQQAKKLARLLSSTYGLGAGKTVGILCRNHLLIALLLPALSRLGVHVRLLNTDMPAQQLSVLLNKKYSLLVYDEEVKDRCLPNVLPCRAVSAELLREQLMHENEEKQGNKAKVRLPIMTPNATLSVFTGGSSGNYKEASRQTGVFQFLPPFVALLRAVGIMRYRSILIALPFYHGFGLCSFIVSLILGKTICLQRHFDVPAVLDTIRQEQIEVLPVVPAMLARIWQQPEAENCLHPLRCIISGGDHLDSSLSKITMQRLGPILYNLYGTSEAGFMMMATPKDLQQVNVDEEKSSTLIGRPICGVQCEVRQKDEKGVGTLWVRTGWSITDRKHQWQCTGDLMSCDSRGCFHHHGRADRMVVCGGENVSLDGVEQVITSHPDICSCVVYPASDVRFGQVLHANVELASASDLTVEELHKWLSVRLSRAEIPHQITFGPVEVLSTGKRKNNK